MTNDEQILEEFRIKFQIDFIQHISGSIYVPKVEVESFLLSALHKTREEYKGKTKREWYGKGYREACIDCVNLTGCKECKDEL